MNHEEEAAVLRIGELSRRVGVSEHVLRAWESRYGLLRPERSAGGYRLYSEADQGRVRRMQAYLSDGLAAAQAAEAAIADDGAEDVANEGSGATSGAVVHPGGNGNGSGSGSGSAGGGVAQRGGGRRSGTPADSAEALRQALDAMDEPAAQSLLDRLLTDFTVESVLRDVVLPYLQSLGDRWESGEVSVAQEHFASHVLRGRLSGLARGWGTGSGPRALLACPPGEEHDLALLAFGIVLNRGGWRVEFLGGNTPIQDTLEVTRQTRPGLVVIAAHRPDLFAAILPDLTALSQVAPLVLAGAGATAELAQTAGARLLDDDPVTAAQQVAGS